MDVQFLSNGDSFVWNAEKALANWHKHGVRFEELASALFPRAARRHWRSPHMLSEHLKKRLVKNRPMTSITLRIPVDVVDSMKQIAPLKGVSGYQTLLKSYISDGLRRDEARFSHGQTARLIEALKKRGVSTELLDAAARDTSEA